MCGFWANHARKDSFFRFLIKKNTFQKSNLASYHVGFFGQTKAKKDRFLIFWIEKKTFQSRKVKFQKHPKNRIFQVHRSCQKIELFTMCVFWQPKEEKIAFYYSGQKRILLRPVSKTSEKSNFLKGLVHVFCQKQSCLRCEFFQANQGRKDRFLIFWIGKNKFQTRKVKSKKDPKKSNFSKRLVHGFCQKN